MAKNESDTTHGEAARCIQAARLAMQHRDFEVAEENLRRALTLDDRQPAAHNLLGVLHEVRGERRKAQDSYRDALNLDAAYTPARFNLRQSVEPHKKRNFMLAELKRPGAARLPGQIHE